MFFKKQKNEGVTLVIDIGTSSVGAAIVLASKGAPPKIIFSTRSKVALKKEPERANSVASIINTLETVMNDVIAQHAVIRKSHIFFSSPWYASETLILKNDYNSPTLITHHIVDKLIKEAEQKLVGGSHLTGEVVEHRIIRTRLNGYNIPDPYNKKAQNLEVTFLASTISKDILDSVLRSVGKHVHLKNNQVSSFSLASWIAISGILPAEQDFLIIDVRSETTDISLVKEGTLIKSLSFPFGKHTLVQSVAHHSKQSVATALSLISIVIHEGSEPSTTAKLLNYSATFKQNWLQAYTKTLEDMSIGVTAPQAVILMADSDVEVFFENILNESKKDGLLYSLKYLNLLSFIDTTSVPTDQFLALESIFVTMV